jgi:DNA-directed RNA polymerase specialized sigma subunit
MSNRLSKLVVDLHYGWELSRQEIAAILGWSASQVSRTLTRAISLLKYQLHPEVFTKAKDIPSY